MPKRSLKAALNTALPTWQRPNWWRCFQSLWFLIIYENSRLSMPKPAVIFCAEARPLFCSFSRNYAVICCRCTYIILLLFLQLWSGCSKQWLMTRSHLINCPAMMDAHSGHVVLSLVIFQMTPCWQKRWMADHPRQWYCFWSVSLFKQSNEISPACSNFVMYGGKKQNVVQWKLYLTGCFWCWVYLPPGPGSRPNLLLLVK